MRIRTLIATTDTRYTSHISEYIAEHHADTMEISVCSTDKQLQKILSEKNFDVALMDSSLIRNADFKTVNLPMLLWTNNAGEDVPATIRKIRKHRRISLTVADILEEYATITDNPKFSSNTSCGITAVWSPSGGVGKTTVALAYAASKTLSGKEVLYLNLETFSAAPVYFNERGKSISAVFEMLEGDTGNTKMLIQGISVCESGIRHLGTPDNFDDICILSPENVQELITCSTGVADELVIDLSGTCDSRTRQVFELVDKVLLVTDCSDTAKAKLSQFISQSNVFESIKTKIIPVANKTTQEGINSLSCDALTPLTELKPFINLPHIPTNDAQLIYKTLAKNDFGF